MTLAARLDRSLPRPLQREAWWLSAAAASASPAAATPSPQGAALSEVAPSQAAPPKTVAAESGTQAKAGTDHGPPDDRFRWPPTAHLAALIACVIAANLLLYHRWPGLAFVPFAVTVFLATVATLPGRRIPRGPALLLVASQLPLIEHHQLLAVAFAVSGLAVSLVWARAAARPGAAEVALKAAQLLLSSVKQPFRAIRFASLAVQAGGRGEDTGTMALKAASRLAFPLLGATALLVLLAVANPVIEGWIDQLFTLDIHFAALLWRVVFLSIVASFVWPFLSWPGGVLPQMPALDAGAPAGRWLGLNAGSVTLALVLFNAMLLVQVGTDVRYLLAGGELPEGLTYSAYARRGAFALMATAVLAGGFAVLARPYLGARPGLRGLMYLWLAQNLALTGAAGYRLWMYVEAYGLTTLRIHAAIWTVLVGLGLVLIAWQIRRERSTGWLLRRVAALALATLYLCSFVNFSHIVASHNIARLKGPGEPVCETGYPVAPSHAPSDAWCKTVRPRIDSWRDWDFRTWRTIGYLEAEKVRRRMNENPGRR
ncbi:DUF4153 domain-containing protein [Stappia sp. 28M-7]|uniref:DUF4153 domain-containing protein n=1 Tax=Stappia sp. 28M-7 TaxID=2762596 RepID=UPI00163BE8E0|nr:DUF4173 domain-containing protein [Stappia sp. 28M-7]MBC2858135.1 DUF4173 domain-containing protein [Stappia sp. 28M-7]